MIIQSVLVHYARKYICPLCDFCLDINCSLYHHLNKVGENFYHSKDEVHQQLPFFLFENQKDKLVKTVACFWCHQPLADSTYIIVSAECKIQLHKRCFDELPTQIDHPCHRIHPLFLEFDYKKPRLCKVCQKGDDDKNFFYYHCFACNFDIHLQCIWPRPVIEDKRYHEHPFTLLWRRDSFPCDACGTHGNFASYVCCTCHLQVHVKCASLPRTIKISRHYHHPLSHKYLLNTKQLECQVCFDPVKTEFGHYHSLKADCSYVAHVECATGDPDLYEVIEDDQNVAPEDMEDCFSFRVIERDKDGEATKIRHFLHDEDEDEHGLVLLEMKQEDSRRCDGCVVSLSISGSADPFYYSCLKCDFLLHKGCAEFPKKMHHWYDRFFTTLRSDQGNFFICYLCDRRCSGLYYIYQGWRKFCLRCAKTPNIIKSGQEHKHRVFFDHKCRGRCNACGRDVSRYGAFKCKDCSSFMLDFACVTLPRKVENKRVCDQHLLQLITTDADADADAATQEEEEAYCDICEICETKRDPKLWYYHCATCDTSAHPSCVLGQDPFIKTGTIGPAWPSCRNGHTLRFARKKIYEYPPQCSGCGEHCTDLFLECAPCNYILHFWQCP